MTSNLSIRPVTTEAEYKDFLYMPWRVYKDTPNWSAPLWSEHVKFFDAKKNPELKHLDLQKFIAYRGDQPVGTIVAFVNRAYNEFYNENTGWFGQFELLNDPEVGAALLGTAEDWLRGKGVNKIMGPATYSTNSEIGLLIKGHDTPSMILMPYHQPYYQGFVEGCGYTKSMDLFAWWVDAKKLQDTGILDRVARLAEKLVKRKHFTVRTVRMNDWNNEIGHVKRLYNQAWTKNWGFIPMNDDEIAVLAAGMKDMIDPNIVVVVEVDSVPVAFAVPLPDLNVPMRAAKMKAGENEILQLIRLLWNWKVVGKIDRVRVWGMGILEEYRGTGVDALMYYEMLKRGLARGYKNIEMSWILENNDMMNRAIQNFGGEIYKTYRVYEKVV